MDVKYWDLAKQLMDRATGTDTTKGIEAIKNLWNRNKGYLEPFFDDNGQVVIKLEEGGISEECMQETFKEAKRIAAVISSTTEKYIGIIKDNGKGAIDYLERLCRFTITPNEFKDNSLARKRYTYDDNKPIQAGTKVTKFIRMELESERSNIWSHYNNIGANYRKEHREEVISFIFDVYSQIVGLLRTNEDYVVLSINPVDLMLCSYHTTGWQSCHRILPSGDQGDWRTASISFLCDGVSAIAFAYRTIDPVKEVSFEWSRKLWRQMVFFDKKEKGAFQGNEYPSKVMIYSHAMRTIVADVLAKVCGDTSGKYHFKPYYQDSDLDGQEVGSFYMEVDAPSWLSCDDPSIGIRLLDGKYPNIYVGAERIPCLKCGHLRDHDDNDENYSFVCEDCGGGCRKRCVSCDERYDEDDMYDTVDGSVCDYCYNEYYRDCEDCGDCYNRDNLNSVELVESGSGYLCDHCLHSYFECDECGCYDKNGNKNDFKGKKLCQECFDEANTEEEEAEKEEAALW
jgi:hypothetical protein